MRQRSVLWLVVLAGCAGSGSSATPRATPTVVSITADDLRRDLTVFASDSFEGRETGTPAAFRAARFIAQRLAALGVEPGGDSLYLQRVPLIRDLFEPSTRIAVTQAGRP